MSTIVSHSELTRKVIEWISEQMNADASRTLGTLLNEASERYDLSPKDFEFLQRFYAENKENLSK